MATTRETTRRRVRHDVADAAVVMGFSLASSTLVALGLVFVAKVLAP